jgi:uncharacterized protein YllA (UPF0747 family)
MKNYKYPENEFSFMEKIGNKIKNLRTSIINLFIAEERKALLLSYEENSFFMKIASREFKDKEFMFEVIRQRPERFKYINKKFKSDKY